MVKNNDEIHNEIHDGIIQLYGYPYNTIYNSHICIYIKN